MHSEEMPFRGACPHANRIELNSHDLSRQQRIGAIPVQCAISLIWAVYRTCQFILSMPFLCPTPENKQRNLNIFDFVAVKTESLTLLPGIKKSCRQSFFLFEDRYVNQGLI
jgi:hypothetical protein